jgi:archaellum component FlaF (FlaF/FlaG flagellin family)
MGVKGCVCRTLNRFLRNRRGTAEIVGTVMFLVILLFFFSNVYLWHDQATREMDNLVLDRVNSPVRLFGGVDPTSDTLKLNVTNNGGVGVRLSRLWIITSGYPTYEDLEDDDIWLAGGETWEIDYGAPPVEDVTFRILTDLGNTASWKYTHLTPTPPAPSP